MNDEKMFRLVLRSFMVMCALVVTLAVLLGTGVISPIQ